ncbi:MAG: response regulator [Flavobacteriales bacterium]|nr:response regulator [Flavobacteriales bacterium]
MARIIIIEDEQSIRNVLKNILKDENKNYIVDEASNGLEAIEKISSNQYDLALCDIKMPKADGLEVLIKSKELEYNLPFIMISGHGDLETAVECIKNGAYDYISKPPDLNRLLTTIRNGLNKKDLEHQNKILKNKVQKKYNMIGGSNELLKIEEIISKVAPTNSRVLITGENGTGKELVAHSIHNKSSRAKIPIVEVNCAAIPSELIESELFGHEKGSFTSANKQKKGKFEIASGGTIFLDEIGDMSLSAQAKVLRALQENKITRVGGEKDINIDVRIIAATNKNLEKLISEEKFREDLYHRISVIKIHVPPLRDRKEDIPLLIDFFLNSICIEQGIRKKIIEQDAIKLLTEKKWTGNIRQLRNIVERLIILSENYISKSDVELYV